MFIMHPMNEKLLAQMENRLESLIEGAFTRLFRRSVSTHELVRQLSRSMETQLDLSETPDPRPIAPDTYAIILNDSVVSRFQQRLPGLPDALSQYLIEMAGDSGYRLLNTPQVTLIPDAHLAADGVRVEAGHSNKPRQSTQAMQIRQPPDTLPEVRNPYLILNGEESISLKNNLINIGRSDSNDIVIENDPYISRHHVQLRRRSGTYILFDVQSKAGTRVNNVVVREHTLQTGDVIRIGATQLTYVMDEPSGSASANTTHSMPPVNPD